MQFFYLLNLENFTVHANASFLKYGAFSGKFALKLFSIIINISDWEHGPCHCERMGKAETQHSNQG
jgi:hypothetical protein